MPYADDSASTPTATSIKKGSSIIEAPAERNLDLASLIPNEEPLGDPSQRSEAGADSPGRQPGASGDAGGNRPSKPTAAGPSADPSAVATRSLRRDSATLSSKTCSLRSGPATLSSRTAEAGRKKGGSGPPSSGRDGGSQPPPSLRGVSRAPIGGVSGASAHGASRASNRGVSGASLRVEQPGVEHPGVEQPRVEQPRVAAASTTRGVSGSSSGRISGTTTRGVIEPSTPGGYDQSPPVSPADLRAPEVANQSYIGDSDSSASDGNDIDSTEVPPLEEPPDGRSSQARPATRRFHGAAPLRETDVDSEGSPGSSFSDPKDVDHNSSAQQGEHHCPHPQCNKCYTAVKDAVKHINRDHDDHFILPNTFARCLVCGKVYTKAGLKNHKCTGSPRVPRLPRTPFQQPPSPASPLPPPEGHLAVIPDPDIGSLHRFYNLELTWIHAKWRPLLQQLHLLLLQNINSRDATTSDESFSAYLLLPGFLEAVRLANRLPGAKQLRIEPPITYLRIFTSAEHAEHPEQVILTTTAALHNRVRHSLATRPSSHSTEKSKALNKICALAQIGRTSKAARLADNLARVDDSDDGLPASQVTRDNAISALPDLFPAASALDDIGEQSDDDGDLEQPLQITASEVASAITRLSIDRASGFSGWSNRLLKQLYLGSDPSHQQLIADNYATLFNTLLKGRASEHIRSYLTDVRLCLIPKSGDPSHPIYRPIGIGETIFRLLGRTILAKVGKAIGDTIAPYQLAVGISGGVEIAASLAGMLEAINDSQPAEDTPFAMLSIDIKNAFNRIRRSHVLRGLRNHCPSLIPFFTIVYGQPVNLRWGDGSIIGKAATGVIQGDPLSTLYFALGIQPLLLELQATLRRIEADSDLPSPSKSGLLFAIADDITILARTETLFALSSALPSLFERYDLPLNQSKTWIMGPQVHLQDGDTNLPCRTMRDGGKILGTPVGNIHFILSWLRDHFHYNGPPLSILGHLPARAAITLLKFSYNTRMDYLRKTSSEAIVNTGIFAAYDALIDSAILTTGVADNRDRIHQLRALPLHQGGLGMPLLEGNHGRRHHLVTAMRGREFLKLYYSHFLHNHVATFNTRAVDIDGTAPDEIAETLVELRAKHPTEDALSIFTAALRRWGEDTDTEAAASFHQDLIANNENEAAAVFLSVQGVKQSFIVFSTSYRQTPETLLNNREYIEAMRFFLLSPFKMNADGYSTCRCRRENPWNLTTHPFHASNCPLNSSERTFRHSMICKLLCKLLRKASPASRVSSEPRNSTAAVHPDIAVEENALLFHVDVSVVEPTSVHALAEDGGSATTKGAAAGLKEEAKRAKYQGTEWANVIPFVLESTGHLGKEAEALLDKTTAGKRTLRAWFNEELSLILARSQGKMRIKAHALLR